MTVVLEDQVKMIAADLYDKVASITAVPLEEVEGWVRSIIAQYDISSIARFELEAEAADMKDEGAI
jgi:hypothetical protein